MIASWLLPLNLTIELSDICCVTTARMIPIFCKTSKNLDAGGIHDFISTFQ
jgi:hypothetical protein